jgi:phosphatidylinositol alpha-1,6-mannosyltransferase
MMTALLSDPETAHGLPDPARTVRVAFVRGPFTNKQELIQIEAIGGPVRMTVVTSAPGPLDTPLEVRRVGCIGTVFEGVPKIRRLYRMALERTFGNPMILTGLEAAVREHDVIDVPETYNYFSAQAARLAVALDKRLVVSVYENTPGFKEELAATRRIKAEVRARADLFIAKTEQVRKCLIAEGVAPGRIRLVHSGIDTRMFSPRPRDPALLARFGLAETDLVLLTVARLVWEKGVGDVIRALLVARAFDPTATRRLKLLVIGDGPERGRLAALARSLGLGDQVRFGGPVAFDRIPDVYALADIAILASKPYSGGQEQEARVLREGLASGKPYIVTACGGVPEVVGDAALVVPPADHVALGEAIMTLLRDRRLRETLGRQARSRAATLYDYATSARRIREVYLEAAAGGCLGRLPAAGPATQTIQTGSEP